MTMFAAISPTGELVRPDLLTNYAVVELPGGYLVNGVSGGFH
jgi:hypothetical protein